MVEIRPKLSQDGSLLWQLYEPLTGRYVVVNSRGEAVEASAGQNSATLDFLCSALSSECESDRDQNFQDQTRVKKSLLAAGSY